MEKLRKYVEEMQKEGINICRPTFQEYYLLEMMLVSKHYGLIKWLVDNDKIDLESYCRITSVERMGEEDVYRDEYESLLMLLSIQDEPISFLCSVLK